MQAVHPWASRLSPPMCKTRALNQKLLRDFPALIPCDGSWILVIVTDSLRRHFLGAYSVPVPVLGAGNTVARRWI